MDANQLTTSRTDLSVDEKEAYLERIFNINNAEARRILGDCNYDLEQAAQSLVDLPYPSTESKASAASEGASASANIDHATGTQLNPIDLTTESSADPELQKALALSMQQVGGSNQQQSVLSAEDEELSRAVEASLAANQENMTRLGLPKSALFVDPQNPHERKRIGNTPVGLKNIGNTCWFSAVVQSLLHIPVFCDKILSYSAPPAVNGSIQQPPCVNFLVELQKLFALLLFSQRKYIDPSFVIQTFKEVFSKEKGGEQQDVSEFTIKLLEWIEEAFSQSLGKDSANPMAQLFTGHCRREGTNNGEEFHNDEDFGALHLQVHEHSHIHDCLEAYTFNPEVAQETWFTRLPPILVLSLSRFKYNQHSGQAEKVHDELKFDLELTMDRYLEANREESQRRRKDVAKLKQEIEQLRNILKSYHEYNSSQILVVDALKLTLQFVQERGWDDLAGQGETAEKRARISQQPSPQSVSQEERSVLDTCLNRWIDQLKREIQELCEQIDRKLALLDAMYSDPLMKNTPYHLHAVLVHQGQASLGHYWAYVHKDHACILPRDQPSSENIKPLNNTGQYSSTEAHALGQEPVSPMENSPRSDLPEADHILSNEGMDTESTELCSSDLWLKFNDVSVSEVSWEVVQKESYGGSQNTSAYCLIYISKELSTQFKHEGIAWPIRDELKRYVERDTSDFQTELQNFDNKRQIEEASHISSGSERPGISVQPPSPLSSSAGADQAGPAQPGINTADRSRSDKSLEQMQVDSPPIPSIDPDLTQELASTIESTCTQFANRYPASTVDSRPSHIITYALHSGAHKDLSKMLVLEAIIQLCSDPSKADLRTLAQKEFISMLSIVNRQAEINKLREVYQIFCAVCWNFILAVKFLKENKWEGVLTHSLKSYELHRKICEGGEPQFSLNHPHLMLLLSLRRRSLQMVSDMARDMFEAQKAVQALQVANELLVPCLTWFSNSAAPQDEGVVESIREKWCQFLSNPSLTDMEQDKLGDLLMKMFDEPGKQNDLSIASSGRTELSLPPDYSTHTLVLELTKTVEYLENH